jgi:hypothetical protein
MDALKDKSPVERKNIIENFSFLYGNDIKNKNFINEMINTDEEIFENDFLDRIFNLIIRLSDKYFFTGREGKKIKGSNIDKTKEYEVMQMLLEKINLDKDFVGNLFTKIYRLGVSHFNKKKNLKKAMGEKYIIVEEIMEKIDIYLLESVDICYH